MKAIKKQAVLLSIFIWGSGQFFICRQRLKGCLLFFLQCLFLGIELQTGYWIEWMSGRIKNFEFRLHGGFFTKGLWGLLTLGEKPGRDHSAMLLINGIIALLLMGFFLAVYIWNIKDAYNSGEQIEKTGLYLNAKEYGRQMYNRMFPYIILFPIGVLFLFVIVMPILFSCLTAFLNYNKDHLPPGNLIDWVGFSNFAKLFKVPIWSNTFFKILTWNIIWACCATFSTYFLGIFQALLLNHKSVKAKKLFQTILILPWAVPQMITLLVFRNLLNSQFGPINQYLLKAGVISERIPFLTDPLAAKITVIAVNLWLGFPMFMVMMLGVLANFDSSLYEAAAIDGASKLQLFRFITMPLIFLATAPLLIMNFAGNFNGFSLIYFLTKGGPLNSEFQFAGDTDILISWIYKLTLQHQMYNMAAVMNILIFILVGAVSYWNFKRTISFQEV